MAEYHDIFTITRTAGGAITEHRFVKHDGTQAGAGENALGIATFNAATGAAVAVTVLGTQICEAGAAVAIGDPIKADASGRGIPQAASGAILGRALSSAAASGDNFEIALITN